MNNKGDSKEFEKPPRRQDRVWVHPSELVRQDKPKRLVDDKPKWS